MGPETKIEASTLLFHLISQALFFQVSVLWPGPHMYTGQAPLAAHFKEASMKIIWKFYTDNF